MSGMSDFVKSTENVPGITQEQKNQFLSNINYELGKIYARERVEYRGDLGLFK